MTVLADTDNVVTGFKAGAADYVTKPIRIPELLARIQTQLELRRFQAELKSKNQRLQQEVVAQSSELAQSLSNWPKASPGYFADMKKKLKGFVDAGQLGIFAKAYWGHPAYKLPPEANLMAVAHYIEALEWQRDVVKLHAIFGGKNPHPMFLVGGTPNPIDLESDSAINAKRLSLVQSIIDKMRVFVDQVYVPDTIAVAGFYKDWFFRGERLGNFLVLGDFPSAEPGSNLRDPSSWWIPPGAILDRNLDEIHEVDLRAEAEVQEYVAHSWYDYADGKDAGLHPWDGVTEANFELGAATKGSRTNIEALDESRQQAAEYLDTMQRVAAEFDNFRKRSERERQDQGPKDRRTGFHAAHPITKTQGTYNRPEAGYRSFLLGGFRLALFGRLLGPFFRSLFGRSFALP